MNDKKDPRLARDREEPRSDSRGGDDRAMSARDWEQANQPTDPEVRRRFRERWQQTHLPDLPVKPGWHRVWASTSHPTNTPQRMEMLGYNYIKMEDLKGTQWNSTILSVKDGAPVDGLVRHREMIAMECREEDYQAYMREFHHDQPMDMERAIVEPLQATQERIMDAGGRVQMGDGFAEMMRFRRADKQFE